MGTMYTKGQDVRQSYVEAMKHLLQAAERGNDVAYDNLGDLYKYGHGVDIDLKKVFQWYFKSSTASNKQGQLHLCIMYLEGLGTEQDLILAMEWVKMAWKNENREAYKYLVEIEEKQALQQSSNNDPPTSSSSTKSLGTPPSWIRIIVSMTVKKML